MTVIWWMAALVMAQPEAALAERVAVWETACAEGEAAACVEVGAIVAAGVIGEPDAEEAQEYFTAACESGEATGCRELGTLLTRGPVELRDAEAAQVAFDRACSLGERSACRVVQRERAPVWEGASSVERSRESLERAQR